MPEATKHPLAGNSVSDIAPDSAPAPASVIEQVLQRPDEQRLREHKFRFSQAVVFGLPVLALQLFGSKLGGLEAKRWVVILQAVLAGWVAWTGTAGMLFEGVLLFQRRVAPDFVAACVGVSFYLIAIIMGIRSVMGYAEPGPFFSLAVIWIAGWTGWQWWRYERRARASGGA